MQRSEAFPSKWLNKTDIQHPTQAVIARVEMQEVGFEDDKENKPVMTFRGGHIKPMTLNAGNWDTLEQAYGHNSDEWIGKPVEIFIDPDVKYAGKKVGGLRVRLPSAPAPSAAVPFGPAWARALNEKVLAVALKYPLCTTDALRSYLHAAYPEQEALIASDVEHWPRAWNESIRAFFDGQDNGDIPF